MARGWRGSPPVDDAEARDRIISAAMRCVDRYGITKTGLSDVAAELGVTRQTVYRLYASTDDLLIAVAQASVESYLDRLAAHVAGLTDPAAAVVEGIAFTVEQLPREKIIGPVLMSSHADAALRGVTSEQAILFARAMLARMDVDWADAGFDDRSMDGLAEFGLRMLQSLVLDPRQERSSQDLREFLTRWLAPAIGATLHQSG